MGTVFGVGDCAVGCASEGGEGFGEGEGGGADSAGESAEGGHCVWFCVVGLRSGAGDVGVSIGLGGGRG